MRRLYRRMTHVKTPSMATDISTSNQTGTATEPMWRNQKYEAPATAMTTVAMIVPAALCNVGGM